MREEQVKQLAARVLNILVNQEHPPLSRDLAGFPHTLFRTVSYELGKDKECGRLEDRIFQNRMLCLKRLPIPEPDAEDLMEKLVDCLYHLQVLFCLQSFSYGYAAKSGKLPGVPTQKLSPLELQNCFACVYCAMRGRPKSESWRLAVASELQPSHRGFRIRNDVMKWYRTILRLLPDESSKENLKTLLLLSQKQTYLLCQKMFGYGYFAAILERG